MKPSPPRTLPPDHSDSDSDTGGEIEWSDPQDFIRSDSIIQVSAFKIFSRLEQATFLFKKFTSTRKRVIFIKFLIFAGQL